MRRLVVVAAVLASCASPDGRRPTRLATLVESSPPEPGQRPPRPARPLALPAVDAPARLSSGSFHTCMIDDGQVWCWGHGIAVASVLGRRAPYISNSKVPRRMTGVTDALEVASGKFFTCARLASGQVHCWGKNDQNQLGGRQLSEPARRITAGANHACALLVDGSVECWGRYFAKSGTKQLIAGGARQISAGAMHTCVLMDDGGIQCLGKYGVPFLSKGARKDFIGVASGYYHACGWTQSGKVYCWGNPSQGALGREVQGKHVREPIEVEVEGVIGVRRVSAGAAYACATLATGRVQCWGHDGYGQRGVRVSSKDGRQLVTGLDRAVEVAAGGRHVCARTDENQVYCWGDNNWGELGNGSVGKTWRPQRVRWNHDEPTRGVVPDSSSVKRRIRFAGGPGLRVQYDLDSVAELSRDGWTRMPAGTSTFHNGVLVIDSNGGEGWRLGRKRPPRSPWWTNAGGEPGWAFEARVRVHPKSPPVSKSCSAGGPGFYVHDGYQALRILITPTAVRLGTLKGQAFSVPATRGYHTYRLERTRRRLRILIDGQVVHSLVAAPAPAGSRDHYLKFGDMGCSRATSYWDYVAYETARLPAVAAGRGDWHRGARVERILEILDRGLPAALRGSLKGLRLPRKAARCVAVIALDQAARDTVPKSWDAIGMVGNRNLLRKARLLADPSERSRLALFMSNYLKPTQICAVSDPRCRRPPPRPRTPPGYGSLMRALELSTEWGGHPTKIYESMEQVASVYAATSQVPGIALGTRQMIARIASLDSAISQDCNLP